MIANVQPRKEDALRRVESDLLSRQRRVLLRADEAHSAVVLERRIVIRVDAETGDIVEALLTRAVADLDAAEGLLERFCLSQPFDRLLFLFRLTVDERRPQARFGAVGSRRAQSDGVEGRVARVHGRC